MDVDRPFFTYGHKILHIKAQLLVRYWPLQITLQRKFLGCYIWIVIVAVGSSEIPIERIVLTTKTGILP